MGYPAPGSILAKSSFHKEMRRLPKTAKTTVMMKEG
jgi:hypothetical protein